MSESKTYYLAVYGRNQIPFESIEDMKEYFVKGENIFDAIMQDVKTYKIIIEPINLKDYA